MDGPLHVKYLGGGSRDPCGVDAYAGMTVIWSHFIVR